jgi:Fe-S-cluster containining protein/ribosomal protein S18 acetylase RimI-like enzyme
MPSPDTGPTRAPIDAGPFAAWLRRALRARHADLDTDVPCHGCSACCSSSQFVQVRPDERETIAAIPRELLIPAPGLPAGYTVLGFDGAGRCPLLENGRCTIYDRRPQTCRTYDCRVYAAAGVRPAAPAIADRVERWRFARPGADDADLLRAVHDAAAWLDRHSSRLPEETACSPADVALLALDVHEVFVSAQPAAEEVESAVGRAAHLADVALRPLPAADLPAAGALCDASLGAGFWTLDVGETGVRLGARRRGELLGVGAAELVADGVGEAPGLARPVGLLRLVAVAPPARRRGVASLLVRELCAAMVGQGAASLAAYAWVYGDVARAAVSGPLEREGFVRERRLEEFYASPRTPACPRCGASPCGCPADLYIRTGCR